MTGPDERERIYRRWLRWYPRWFRVEHEEEMLGVLLASTSGAGRPGPMERLDLVRGGLGVRQRPRVPHADRSGHLAIRLMKLGAVVEAAVAATVWGTEGQVKANIVARNPRYTAAQWHAEVGGSLAPVAIAAAAFVVIWLWMAWANGRGRRWAKVVFGLLFAETTFSLLHGLSGGSATYAAKDLVAGVVLWLVEFAAVIALVCSEVRRLAVARALPAAMAGVEEPC